MVYLVGPNPPKLFPAKKTGYKVKREHFNGFLKFIMHTALF